MHSIVDCPDESPIKFTIILKDPNIKLSLPPIVTLGLINLLSYKKYKLIYIMHFLMKFCGGLMR